MGIVATLARVIEACLLHKRLVYSSDQPKPVLQFRIFVMHSEFIIEMMLRHWLERTTHTDQLSHTLTLVITVFLGGSCGGRKSPTTWRKEVAIPLLTKNDVTFFNPVSDYQFGGRKRYTEREGERGGGERERERGGKRGTGRRRRREKREWKREWERVASENRLQQWLSLHKNAWCWLAVCLWCNLSILVRQRASWKRSVSHDTHIISHCSKLRRGLATW